MFATVGGITHHYSREGREGGIPLLFINSLGTDLRLWQRLVPHFAGRFTIIRYDKRGHGLSDCPPGPYSIEGLANDLAALLEHLGVQEAIVIGISVGGMIAMDFTARYPQRVRALVLSDTTPQIGSAAGWKERISLVSQQGLDGAAKTILARWFADGFADRQTAEYRGYVNMLSRMPAAGYIATCAALRDADLRGLVTSVRQPALVLCGAEDRSTPPERVRSLAQVMPDARFAVIEAAGHLPCVEQPERMAREIDQFLDELGYG